MISSSFPFVQIPIEFAKLIGHPDPGTRTFRREGNQREMQEWHDALAKHIGFCVSPGGAATYAGVTRAGVYNRIKAAGLSAFCFHLVGKEKTFFGGERKLKEHAIVYVPVSECQAWRKELGDRITRINAAKELSKEDNEILSDAYDETVHPDPNFLLYDPGDKRKRGVRYRNPFWDKSPMEEQLADEEEDAK